MPTSRRAEVATAHGRTAPEAGAPPNGAERMGGAGPTSGVGPTSPPQPDRTLVGDRPLTAPELEDRWRRALADLDNLRKRCARQVAAEQTAERDRVIMLWLPIIDDLDRALEHAGPQALIEGVRAVRDQAIDLVAALGYPRDDETGMPFDPVRHQAVGVVSSDDELPFGTVVRVLRPGYGSGERQLRPASVVVANGG